MFEGKGRTIVISGMANLCSKYLLEHGYNVVLCAHSQEQADKMSAAMPEELRDRFMPLYCMIGEPEDTQKLIDKTIERFGSFNAMSLGIGALENATFEETDKAEFIKIVGSHLNNVYSAMKLCIPTMLKYDSPRIVNFTVVDGLCGHFNFGVASAAGKGGLIGLTRAVALEYADKGLTANCIALGALETLRPIPPEEKERLNKLIPVGRVATGADIAPILCFLASEESRYITGAVINASGGAYMG